jgi:hypothetical protein
MKHFIFLVAFALLAGCTTSALHSPEEADTVPTSRLYGFTKKSDAHLVVVRDSSLSDESCTIRLLIDGESAADLNRGEVAHFGVTIGTHRLLTLPLEGCPSTQMQEVKITVKAGDTLIKRIDGTGIDSIAL